MKAFIENQRNKVKTKEMRQKRKLERCHIEMSKFNQARVSGVCMCVCVCVCSSSISSCHSSSENVPVRPRSGLPHAFKGQCTRAHRRTHTQTQVPWEITFMSLIRNLPTRLLDPRKPDLQ